MHNNLLTRVCSIGIVSVIIGWSSDIFTLVGEGGLLDHNLLSREAIGHLSVSRLPIDISHNIKLLILVDLMALLAVAAFLRPESALFSFLLYTAFTFFKHSISVFAYGVYDFLHIALFYALMLNISLCVSEAARAWRSTVYFFRIHISMAYMFAGISKAVGPHWWNGESMWRALARSDLSGQRLGSYIWLSDFPMLLQFAGIAVVLIESFYPLALFVKYRKIVCISVMCMHVGTVITQGLIVFGTFMILLNIAFIYQKDSFSSHINAH